jgi:hypothetical protein
MSFTNVQSKTTIDAKFSATGKSLISKVGRVAHLDGAGGMPNTGKSFMIHGGCECFAVFFSWSA